MQPIQLGAFELSRRIGTGGMGEVWLAEHVVTNRPVAIKTIHLGQDDELQMGHRFVAEVQAIARLSHPNIVGIHDFGIIPEEAVAGSLGVLQANAPWFAMEFCARGDLLTGRPTDWPSMRKVLVAVLEALAMTHAHGVLHRDLKPANVLIAEDEHGEPLYKLADFGLAWSQDRSGEMDRSSQSVGTPNYMAPEQATGQLHAFGPATDLYALGCLAWSLGTGSAPFTGFGHDSITLMNAQVHAHPPQFRARFDMPRATEVWIRKLLRKEPGRRYQFAAIALDELPPEDALCDLPALPKEGLPELSLPTIEVDSLTPHQQTHRSVHLTTWALASQRETSLGRMAKNWRRRSVSSLPDPGVGAGLMGLRQVPVVGFEAERDRLWRALHRVLERGSSAVVFIEGEAGTGKTRLVNWISQTAHRRGLVQYASASFRGQVEQGSSLAMALATHIGLASGMTQAEALLAVATHLSAHRRDSIEARRAYLTAFDSVVPYTGSKGGSSEQERQETLVGLVSELSAVHPMILVLDDLIDDESALSFAEAILETDDCHCLVIGTYRPEVLAGNERSRGAHSMLLTRPDVSHFSLSPLAPDDCESFLRNLMGISSELARRIADSSNGVPETARQTMMHLVEQDLLSTAPTGLDLDDGSPDVFAGSLAEAIAQRTGEAFSALSAADRRELQLGTLLGDRIESDLHRRLCRNVGSQYSPGLIAELARRGIVDLNRYNWGFVDRIQRQMLLDLIDEKPTADDYQAAAKVLETSDRSDSLVKRWWAARNRCAAGDLEGAMALCRLMEATISEGRYHAAWRMGADFCDLFELPKVVSDESLYFRVRLGMNLCLYRLHRVDEGLADIDDLLGTWSELPKDLRHQGLTRKGNYLHPKKRNLIYEEMLVEGISSQVEIQIRPAMARRCESKGKVHEALEHYDKALTAAGQLDAQAAFPILAKRSALSIAADRLELAESDLIACSKLSRSVDRQEVWSLERRWVELLWAKGEEAEAWNRLKVQADLERRTVGNAHPNTQELFVIFGALRLDLQALQRTADEGLSLGLEPFAEIFEAARVIGYRDQVGDEELQALADVVNGIPARYRLAQVVFLLGQALARRAMTDSARVTLEHARSRLSIYGNQSWLKRCDDELAKLQVT